jgi:hypothetical protein
MTPIGNLYSIDDPAKLHETILRDVIHFQKRHGCQPSIVLVHPDLLNGIEGDIEVVSDKGVTYLAKVQADNRQGLASYMIFGEEE